MNPSAASGKRRVLVILGHPDAGSFCSALAESYTAGAREAGREVRLLRLGDLDFNWNLRRGYQEVTPLEPDLEQAWEGIEWADHLAFVYPVWWGTMPALQKAFIDRVFLPGKAFRFREGSSFWDRLLAGRSARLITTMDTPAWYYRFIYGSPGTKAMKRMVLQFSGIRPVRVATFAPVRSSTAAKRSRWLEKARQTGSRD